MLTNIICFKGLFTQSFFDYHDPVTVYDGIKSVGYRQHCALKELIAYGLLYQCIGSVQNKS